MEAIVADRGQVTIPKALRKRLGIAPRTRLDFTAENGRLVAVKVTGGDPVSRVLGCLKTGARTDDMMKELRGNWDHE